MHKPRQELTEQELRQALDHCDTEPIHIPGSIQTHGCMIVLDAATQTIVQASENIERFTGYKQSQSLGQKINTILGEGFSEIIQPIITERELQPIQSTRLGLLGKLYDVAAHRSDMSLIIEIEPCQEKAGTIYEFYDDTRNFAVSMHMTQDMQKLYDHLVDSIRRVSSFGRVKLYKFDEERNGSVIAESKCPEMSSYLGMRFPASDIPVQARILYAKSYIRLIPDIHYAPVPVLPVLNPATGKPLDMSLAMLRSVSPVHIQYLANMGIRASMSVSIMQNGKLWGLVACHNNDPLYVPYKARMAAEIMAHIFSAQLSTRESQAKTEARKKQAHFLERLNAALEKNHKLTELIDSTHELALDAMDANGLVVSTRNQIIQFGDVPDAHTVYSLVKWLGENRNQLVYAATDASQIEGIEPFNGGFLSASLSQHRQDFIIWFRSPIIEEVSWAGNPEKPLEETKAGYRLTPRSSFALWKESVRQRCVPWDDENADTARNVVNIILEGEKLSAEQANLAKSEFLATMSHEIRTPMNAVVGLSTILARSKPLTAQQKNFIDTLQTSADSLLGLINDLLDISKIEAREVEFEHIPFKLDELIEQMISIVSVRAQEQNLKLVVDTNCVKGREFTGDPTRIRQIMLNLCSNAIKFTSKGEVSLTIHCHATDVNGFEDLEIIVADTGIGIAPDKLTSVFKKFEQADNSINRKYGGTGLGLAITKHLVEAMGGTIAVQSELGKGSQFTIHLNLPCTMTGEALSKLPNPHPSLAEHTGKKVLLVEDYTPNVMVATQYLEEFGYAYDVAVNGTEAFELIKKNRYDAILMDVQMHGINGFETTQLIRNYEKDHQVPRSYIVGMTAHALAGDRERCLSSGMDNYISKPFNPDHLQELLSAGT